MDKNKLAFTRKNFILLAIGMAIVIAGFILMAGGGSTETHFDPDIFEARRIKLAPAMCFVGFVFMVMAILYPSKPVNGGNNEKNETKLYPSKPLNSGNNEKNKTNFYPSKPKNGESNEKKEIK